MIVCSFGLTGTPEQQCTSLSMLDDQAHRQEEMVPSEATAREIEKLNDRQKELMKKNASQEYYWLRKCAFAY